MNQNRAPRARFNLARAGRTALLILPLGLALSGLGHHASQAQTMVPGSSCSAVLDSLMSDWQSIGFAEPSKPAQMIVSGQHGYTTTAGHYNYMRQQIRAAARDCEAGRDEAALRHIDVVRANLNHNDQVKQYAQ
jgi:hypothetical protein